MFKDILGMDNAFSLSTYLGCSILILGFLKVPLEKWLINLSSNLLNGRLTLFLMQGHYSYLNLIWPLKPIFNVEFFSSAAILKDLDRTNHNFFWNKDPDSGAANLIG